MLGPSRRRVRRHESPIRRRRLEREEVFRELEREGAEFEAGLAEEEKKAATELHGVRQMQTGDEL